MGCGGIHQNSCEEIFVAMLLYTDHELIDPVLEEALTIHCAECPPCLETLTAHQSNVRLIKELMGNACREEAPERLQNRIIAELEVQAAAMDAQGQGLRQIYSETYSETFVQRTITSDGEFTIEISHTQEFREGF
jgi:hypothetical protein